MARNKITMDHLAVMIKRGFDGQDKRFDAIGKDIRKIKRGTVQLNQSLKSCLTSFKGYNRL